MVRQGGDGGELERGREGGPERERSEGKVGIGGLGRERKERV
jgi:hypothetical protein